MLAFASPHLQVKLTCQGGYVHSARRIHSHSKAHRKAPLSDRSRRGAGERWRQLRSWPASILWLLVELARAVRLTAKLGTHQTLHYQTDSPSIADRGSRLPTLKPNRHVYSQKLVTRYA